MINIWDKEEINNFIWNVKDFYKKLKDQIEIENCCIEQSRDS